MNSQAKYRLVGLAWIVSALLIFFGGYVYFLKYNREAFDVIRCARFQKPSGAIQNLKEPLECSYNLPLENWIGKH